MQQQINIPVAILFCLALFLIVSKLEFEDEKLFAQAECRGLGLVLKTDNKHWRCEQP